MSKALLLIICDFLLLSLLALARFDPPPEEEKEKAPEPTAEVDQSAEDLAEILKNSLEEERKAREELTAQLSQTQEALRERERLLAAREASIRESQEELRRKEEERLRVEAERAKLEARLALTRTNAVAIQKQYEAVQSNLDLVRKQEEPARRDMAILREQFQAAQSNAMTLEEQLASAKSETSISKQILDELQQDLRKQVVFSSQLQEQLSGAEQAQQVIQAEKQELAGKLQVVSAEQRLTREHLETMRTEVAIVRDEKERLETQTTKLTAGVTELAASSEQLKEEIRQNRPMAANTVFNQFITNRVRTLFRARRSGIFGQDVDKQEGTESILVSQGGNIYAVYHVEDTPFSLQPYPTEWESFAGTVQRGTVIYSITQLSFLDRDPRIVIVPIGAPQAEKLGAKVYPVAEDPSKFQEAILIGPTRGYYGECQFIIDPATPHYVRMQRERFSFLSGKFVPSRGDLVLSKTGEVLGVMANKEYCLLLDDFRARRAIPTGGGIQQPATLLSQMYQQIMGLPYRLQ